MDVLHITPEKNMDSIFKYGILRNKPLLLQYNEIMEELYGNEYDIERGLVFCFPEEVSRRDKFIKDFSYWKAWGDVRNRILDQFSYEEFIKYQEIGCNFFSDVKPKLERLKILLLDIEYEDFFTYYKHAQFHSMRNYWTNMDGRYEHDDKPLVLVNYDIKPSKIKRVVGSVESFYERGNINITLDI